MFSGGRDSSLAVVTYARAGTTVRPLRFLTGTGIPSDLPELRFAEIKRAFPRRTMEPVTLPAYGLVRRIAIADIEADFREFGGKNLVLLGEKLAITAASLVYCLANEIDVLADGSSGYQQEMPEQRGVALEFFADLANEVGISYEAPISSYTSADQVKYELWDCGISTKSLEGISIFSDSFSTPDDATIDRYLRAKRHIALQYIHTWQGLHGLL